MKISRKLKILFFILSLFLSYPVSGKNNSEKLDYKLFENTFVHPGIKNLSINNYLVFPAKIDAPGLQNKKEETTRKGYEQRNADKIELMLLRLGFNCIDRSRIDRILSEQKLERTGISVDNTKNVGKLLGADAVVIITIPDMGWYKDQNTSFTDISIKAVSVATGNIIWKSILKGTLIHDFKKIHYRIVVDYIESKLYNMLENKLKSHLE